MNNLNCMLCLLERQSTISDALSLRCRKRYRIGVGRILLR